MTDEELAVGKKVLREAINASGYGAFVTDEVIAGLAWDVLDAAEKVRRAQQKEDEK